MKRITKEISYSNMRNQQAKAKDGRVIKHTSLCLDDLPDISLMNVAYGTARSYGEQVSSKAQHGEVETDDYFNDKLTASARESDKCMQSAEYSSDEGDFYSPVASSILCSSSRGVQDRKTPSTTLINPPPFPCEIVKPRRPKIEHVEAPKEESLYYSRQPRKLDYKPYTLKQYKLMKPKDYVEISNIKPDLNTEVLQAKRHNIERIKEFSKNLQSYNRDIYEQQRKIPEVGEARALEVSKKKQASTRERALIFAKNVPKPVVKKAIQNASAQIGAPIEDFVQTCDEFGLDYVKATQLNALEAKHVEQKRQVDAIKRSFGVQ